MASGSLAGRPAGADTSSEGRIAFRLRIGVTGHRDPASPDELLAAVRGRLAEIRRMFPATATTRVAFVVLSALADGADQLVVRETMRVLREDSVELHAVLPLDPDVYRQELSQPGELDRLLALATERTRMPPASQRHEAYERAGRFIVDHSDLVIALWDGYPGEGPGGTADIVGYAREQGVTVFAVPTARSQHADRTPRFEVLDSADDGTSLASAHAAYRPIALYNRQPARDPRFIRELERERARLAAGTDSSIQRECVTAAAWALPHLIRASHLADSYQRWYNRATVALYGLAAIAVTAVAVQVVYGLSDLFVLIEVAAMLMLLTTYLVGDRTRVQDRWLGYRSLGEAFRSALFINVVAGSVQDELWDGEKTGSVNYPWYQRAFSEAWRDRPLISPPRPSKAIRRFLAVAWIEDQISYHRKAAKQAHRASERFTSLVVVLFATTLLAGGLHVAKVGGSSWRNMFTLLALALPAAGAAIAGIRDQRQYRIHEERYARTADRLAGLKRQLELQTELRSIQKLVAQVQIVIETENQDWSGVAEFQSLEIVV